MYNEIYKEIDEYINSPDSMISIDSIINIVPNINFGNSGPGSLNQETFNTLVSTGDVGLIPERQMNDLKSLKVCLMYSIKQKPVMKSKVAFQIKNRT